MVLPIIQKQNKKTPPTFKEFVENSYIRSYGSKQEWEKARKANKDITSRMKIGNKNQESWVCSDCGNVLVGDIHGNRARIISVKGTKLFVKFTEMAGYCNNENSDRKCNKFNVFVFDSDYDTAREADENNKPRDSLFEEDRGRGLKNKQQGYEESEFIDDYLLKLK